MQKIRRKQNVNMLNREEQQGDLLSRAGVWTKGKSGHNDTVFSRKIFISVTDALASL